MTWRENLLHGALDGVAGQFCGRVHAPHVEATARRYKLTPEQAAAAIADALRGTCNTPCNGPIRKEPRK